MTDTFKTAMQKYQTARDLYGPESIEASNAFTLMMAVAPPEFLDMAGEVAEEMGLMPKPDACTAGGEPLFSLADIAASFGITEEQALALAQEAHDAMLGAGLPGILVDRPCGVMLVQ